MPRIKEPRKYKLIAFKAYHDEDQDILAWWEAIPDGERSEVIRDVVRQYLGLPTKRRKKLIIPELAEVRRDTIWIRDVLNDMPGYLDRIIRDVAEAAANRPVIVQSGARLAAQEGLQDRCRSDTGRERTTHPTHEKCNLVRQQGWLSRCLNR